MRASGSGNLLNVAVFVVKGWLLVCVMMWVRWTLPRLRIDQVMMTCLNTSCRSVACCCWACASGCCSCRRRSRRSVKYVLAIGTAVFVLVVIVSLFRPPFDEPRSGQLPAHGKDCGRR